MTQAHARTKIEATLALAKVSAGAGLRLTNTQVQAEIEKGHFGKKVAICKVSENKLIRLKLFK